MSTSTVELVRGPTLLPVRPRVQASLRVGAVDDPQDREANAVAARITRMPDPGTALANRSREHTPPAGAVDSGRAATRWNQELAAVRVHHDKTAAAAAECLEASAFTIGRDVYFARDSYRPHTSAGRRLLAHEFAHVIQQRKLGARRVQRRIREDLTAWTASRLGPPGPVNGADPRMITIPPTGQILIEADVDVHGDRVTRARHSRSAPHRRPGSRRR